MFRYAPPPSKSKNLNMFLPPDFSFIVGFPPRSPGVNVRSSPIDHSCKRHQNWNNRLNIRLCTPLMETYMNWSHVHAVIRDTT